MGDPEPGARVLRAPSTAVVASFIVGLSVGLVLGVLVGSDLDTTDPAPTTQVPVTTTTTPEPSGFPARDSVGVPDGVTLQASSTNRITTDGTTIDRARITGGLVIAADDVTITRSRIEGNRRLVVECDGCRRLSIDQSDLIGTGDQTQGCIGRTNYTLTRSLVAGCIDGAKANGNVLIEGNWIGDLRRVGASHNDGVQSTGGDGVVIRGNTIVHATGGQTSAVKLTSENQPLTNAELTGNRLVSSTCRAVYFTAKPGQPAPTGRITGNVISGHTCDGWLARDTGPDQTIEGNEVQ